MLVAAILVCFYSFSYGSSFHCVDFTGEKKLETNLFRYGMVIGIDCT